MRTPPNILTESYSNPELNINSDNEAANVGITFRKRKYPDDHLCNQMESLVTMFQEMKTEQNINFSKIEDNILSLKRQNEGIQTMLTTISEQQSQLQSRVEVLEVKEAASASVITSVSDQVENLQRKLLETSIEIRNIPTETNDQATGIVKIIHEALHVDFNPFALRSVYRAYGKPGTSKPIVAEFTAVTHKISLLQAIRKFNKENPTDNFNTSHIGLQTKHVIYIGERLTPKCKKLHFLARAAVKRGEYMSSWTSAGRLYVRKEEGQPGIEIKNASQLPNQPL